MLFQSFQVELFMLQIRSPLIQQDFQDKCPLWSPCGVVTR
jgi:hypothetical protein